MSINVSPEINPLARLDQSIINPLKIHEAIDSKTGSNIGYLPLETLNFPHLGLRINKAPYITDWYAVDHGTDYLPDYLQTMLKYQTTVLRTKLSEIHSSGISEKIDEGSIATPGVHGQALVNEQTGQIRTYPFPRDAGIKDKHGILIQSLHDLALAQQTDKSWKDATIVDHVDGLQRNELTSIASLWDALNAHSLVDGLQALRLSAHLIDRLQKRDLHLLIRIMTFCFILG